MKWHRSLGEALRAAQESQKLIWVFVKHPASPLSAKSEEGYEERDVVDHLTRFFEPLKLEADEDQATVMSLAALAPSTVPAGLWPLHGVLTSDGRPLFACHGLQPRGPQGVGMYMARVKWLWLQEREKMELAAQELTGAVDKTWEGQISIEPESLALDESLVLPGGELLALGAGAAEALKAAALRGFRDPLTGRWRETLIEEGRVMLGSTLRATAVATLVALGCADADEGAAFLAREGLRALEGLIEGGMPRSAEVPYDHRRSFVVSLLSPAQALKVFGPNLGPEVIQKWGLERGWVDPAQEENRLKASAPLWQGGEEGFDWVMTHDLVGHTPLVPLSKGVGASSCLFALILLLRGTGQDRWRQALAQAAQACETLPSCWTERKGWHGQGGFEECAALAWAWRELGDGAAADKALRRGLEFFDALTQRRQAPFQSPTWTIDWVIPSPLALLVRGAAGCQDQALLDRLSAVIERAKELHPSQGASRAGLSWAEGCVKEEKKGKA